MYPLMLASNISTTLIDTVHVHLSQLMIRWGGGGSLFSMDMRVVIHVPPHAGFQHQHNLHRHCARAPVIADDERERGGRCCQWT